MGVIYHVNEPWGLARGKLFDAYSNRSFLAIAPRSFLRSIAFCEEKSVRRTPERVRVRRIWIFAANSAIEPLSNQPRPDVHRYRSVFRSRPT